MIKYLELFNFLGWLSCPLILRLKCTVQRSKTPNTLRRKTPEFEIGDTKMFFHQTLQNLQAYNSM